MKTLRWFACGLAMIGALSTMVGPAVGDKPPSVRHVQARALRDVTRLSVWYADPSRPWELTYNQPGGWVMVVLLVPDPPDIEYQADGSQVHGGLVPVLKLEGVNPFTYQPPTAAIPTTGHAPLLFGQSRLTMDIPLNALGGKAHGMKYQVQMYSLVPIDAFIARLELHAAYTGMVDDNSLPIPHAVETLDSTRPLEPGLPTATAVGGWGALRARYR